MSLITEQIERLRELSKKDKLGLIPWNGYSEILNQAADIIEQLAAKVREENPIIHCKDCAYFEYDVVRNINRVPVIIAHEMCSRWGDGCQTKETGYCYLALAKEKEDKME